MYSESKRVEYLDSIRGLAAFFVLFFHTISAFEWPSACLQAARCPFVAILFDGRAAVCMFFVLSGYVLSKPYVLGAGNTPPRSMFLPTFYLRRFTRIWLPWFFVFVLSILARKYVFTQPPTDPPATDWLKQYWHVPLSVGDFFRQCAFMQHDGTRMMVPQDWSLCVELRGSILIPLFIYLLAPRRMVFLAVFGLAFACLGTMGYHYISFIVGVLLARHGQIAADWCNRQGRPAKILILIFGLIAYQSISLLLLLLPESKLLLTCGWTGVSLGCALILITCFSSRTLQGLLSRKPAVFLGRISYSVYLLQIMVILCLLPWLVSLANQHGIVSRPVLMGMVFLASIGVTIGGAVLLYRFIEAPAINLGHRLTKEWQRRFHPV